MYKMKNNKTDNIEEHFVDLGLPSGLKWAKTNLGAENETDFGNYYMWGSTEPNTAEECNWANAPFNDGSDTFEKKYFNAYKPKWLDDKDNLKPEYDAAYKATDGAARMPTQDDIQELIDNTFHVWVENFNNSNVNGMKFISKTDESKYIFIPASGFRSYSSFVSRGSLGIVWGSSLEDGYPFNALDLFFISDYIDADYGNYRCYGFPVRGVF